MPATETRRTPTQSGKPLHTPAAGCRKRKSANGSTGGGVECRPTAQTDDFSTRRAVIGSRASRREFLKVSAPFRDFCEGVCEENLGARASSPH